MECEDEDDDKIVTSLRIVRRNTGSHIVLSRVSLFIKPPQGGKPQGVTFGDIPRFLESEFPGWEPQKATLDTGK